MNMLMIYLFVVLGCILRLHVRYFLLPLFILFNYISSYNTVQASPTAFLHIGPHKTGTTQLQKFFLQHADKIEQEHLFWPYLYSHTQDNYKTLAYVPISVRFPTSSSAQKILAKFEHTLKSSLKQQRNIFISSENFDSLDATQTQTLKVMLSGFDVRVVFTYRDWLSQLVSWHFELEKSEVSDYTVSFSHFLLKLMDDLPPVLRPLDVLTTYSTVFGKENITLVDYDGVAAANKDIVYVILCEVAGVLCGKTHIFDTASKSNARRSLVPEQLFSQFEMFVYDSIQCENFNKRSLRERFRQEYKQLAAHPPVINSTLSLLRSYAMEVDTAVRSQYEASMLYSNASATAIVREQKVYVEELDEKAFISDPYWHTWFEQVKETAVQYEELCI